MKLGFIGLICGIIPLVIGIILYAQNFSSYFIPLVFSALMICITSLFEIKDYYHQKHYLAFVTGFLVIMWIFCYFKISSDVNYFIYLVTIGLNSLLIILIAIIIIIRWKELSKSIQPYDKALTLKSDDIISLSNKGVELSRQKRYDDAIKCFDKVLEIDSEDTIAFNNRKVLEKKLKHHTLANYLEDTHQLEINEKEGRLILEIKKE